MRIIAGKYRSRIIESITSYDTRPTTDKVKGAIYSSIGPYFDGGKMLDLFGGSGGMSIEAISRGIEYSLICDNNPKAVAIIASNLKKLEIESHCELKLSSYSAILTQCIKEAAVYNLIYLDPPYAFEEINGIIATIDHHNILAPNGFCVVESDAKRILPNELENITMIKAKRYGQIKVSFYKRKEDIS